MLDAVTRVSPRSRADVSSILMVIPKFTDTPASPACTKQMVEDDWQEMLPSFTEGSYGKMKWDPAMVKGVEVQMGMPFSSSGGSGCNTRSFTSAVERKMREQGINYQAYDHVEYWIDEQSGCSWGGLGQVNGPKTWERFKYCGKGKGAGIRVHELGHNFGLHVRN